MRIDLQGFAGEIPKAQPRYLPPANGTTVSACRFTRGDLAPMRSDLLLSTLGASATSIYLHGSTWLSFNYDVDAVPGPVAADRLYLTRGTGNPQLYTGGAFYDLALPAPTEAPVITLTGADTGYTITAPGNSAHKFTFDGGRWVRSDTSVMTTLVTARATASIGFTHLVDTRLAVRRLVAILPKTPATGACLVIDNASDNTLTIHRNGSTINGAASDINTASATRTYALVYNGSTWLASLLPNMSGTIKGSTTSTVSNNFSADSLTAINITLPPAPLNIGDKVTVRRSNTGEVNVLPSGAHTINGASTYAVASRNDRVVFIWNGTEWKAIKFEGKYDDNYTRYADNAVVAANQAHSFDARNAARIILTDLPTGSTGQNLNIAATGGHDVVVLPNGVNIDGVNEPYRIFANADAMKLTLSGVNWVQSSTEIKTMTERGTAYPGETIIGYTLRSKFAIELSSAASDGDEIIIARQGPRLLVVGNLTSEDLAEDVTYAYTWVTSLGEESAPSPASTIVRLAPGRSAFVAASGTPPAGRLVTKKRIYRSVTSASGITDLYLIADILIANSISDDLDNPIYEAIPSTHYDPVPAGMLGLTAMPNGMMAGFIGRQVCFCEPYQPHAWPQKYSINVNSDIVGLVAFGSSLAVLTKTSPWVIQGIHPEAMAAQKIEVNFPCLAKRGIVDLGYAAVYPSTDGLVQITAGGDAKLISSNLWDREQWQAMRPDTFRCAQYIGRYAISYVPLGGTRSLMFLDLTGEMPFLIPVDGVEYRDLIYHVETGRLVGLADDGVSIRSIDDPAATFRNARWKSKPFLLPSDDTFGVVKIDAEPPVSGTPTFQFRVFTDGVLLHTITEPNVFKRLPAKLSDEWSFEFITNWTVSRAIIAGTADELLG